MNKKVVFYNREDYFMAKIITVANQKGGVGKTTLVLNLGAALARMNVKVCLLDCDPQANLTMALGYPQPDELTVTLPNLIHEIINGGLKSEKDDFILCTHNMNFIPSNIELSATENILINSINRENILKKLLSVIKNDYDFILIDTMPSLNFITINALNSADSVLIPMQPHYFSAKGLELLMATIKNVKENLNANLSIEGILMTMYDTRLNFHKEVMSTINETYGKYLTIFETKIPVSIRVTEMQAQAQSVFDSDSTSKLSESYTNFAKELLNGGK
jgi:chromosome partitioning protein